MTTDISNERLAELIRGWQNVAAMDASARELVAALRELASRRALDEWRPIESAPRDGSWFVILRDMEGPHYEVGRYNPLMHPRYVEVGEGLYRKELYSSYDWDGFSNFHLATHWLSLPMPPEGKP